MSQSPIELKGSSFTLSVVHLNHLQPEVIYRALLDKIQQAPGFLQNAPVVLNVKNLPVDVDWPALQKAVTDTGLRIVGVSGYRDNEHRLSLMEAGLTLLNEGKQVKTTSPSAPKSNQNKPRFINYHVRSGQQIYAKNSDLIITQGVSAGAEVIADGNIHIYGSLRGRALAGARGDVQSQIFCTSLSAELVSIAGRYWLNEQIPVEYQGKSTRISLSENALTIQSL